MQQHDVRVRKEGQAQLVFAAWAQLHETVGLQDLHPFLPDPHAARAGEAGGVGQFRRAPEAHEPVVPRRTPQGEIGCADGLSLRQFVHRPHEQRQGLGHGGVAVHPATVPHPVLGFGPVRVSQQDVLGLDRRRLHASHFVTPFLQP